MFLTNSELLEVTEHDYKTATRRVAIVLENGKRNYIVYMALPWMEKSNS